MCFCIAIKKALAQLFFAYFSFVVKFTYQQIIVFWLEMVRVSLQSSQDKNVWIMMLDLT